MTVAIGVAERIVWKPIIDFIGLARASTRSGTGFPVRAEGWIRIGFGRDQDETATGAIRFDGPGRVVAEIKFLNYGAVAIDQSEQLTAVAERSVIGENASDPN